MRGRLGDRLRLYFILDPDSARSHSEPVEIARAAIRGGVTMVQLRWKRAGDREFLALASRTREVCRETGTPFIVNDRVEIALAVEADGVHLGGDDLPVGVARRILPAGAVVGASAGAPAELAALDARPDYLGCGPVRGTRTKSNAGEPIGPAGVARLVGVAGGLPVVAIGGVTPADLPELLALGAAGVGVASGIGAAADPEEQARVYAAALASGSARPRS